MLMMSSENVRTGQTLCIWRVRERAESLSEPLVSGNR